MAPEKSKVRVTVSENGPYVVTGDIPLAKQTIATDAEGGSEAWQKGPDVAHRETYALCRCGALQTKPFCDGSHFKICFDGAETASRDAYIDQAKMLDGPTLQLTDAESLCAFGRFCDPNGNVWSQVTQTDDPEIRNDVHPAGERVSVGTPGGLGQSFREARRTGVASVDRPDWRTPSSNAADRCGCKVGYRSSPRTGLNMNCVIASRFVAAERRRTSRSVTAHTRRSNSETLLRSSRIAEEGFSGGDG